MKRGVIQKNEPTKMTTTGNKKRNVGKIRILFIGNRAPHSYRIKAGNRYENMVHVDFRGRNDGGRMEAYPPLLC